MRGRSRLVVAFVILLLLAPCIRAEDKFFDSNGVKIRYTVEGKGEPVLLIHGFTANIGMQWVLPGVSKALAKEYQVIALDNRGHGKSGKPHDPKKYGMEMVEDTVRLLDHLKIKKAHIVGYSMGAMITCKLVCAHPERVRTATLGGAAGIRKNSDKSFFNGLAESLEQGKGMDALVLALTPAGKPRPSEEQLKAIRTYLESANDTKALAAVVRGFEKLEVADEDLKANKMPTLSLIGEIDPLKRGVDQLKGTMLNLKVVVIDGADHMTAFAKPEFVSTLKEFLAKHPVKNKEKVGTGER